MVIVYALALVVGFAGVVTWTLVGSLASNPKSSVRDPAERFGDGPRDIVTGIFGMGIGGMSASFAGWPATLGVLAAIAGAALLLVSIRIIEHDEPVESGESGT